jgi:hypothetical protein
LKIPIRDYLAAILPGLVELPLNRVDQLTPAAWLAANLRANFLQLPSVNHTLHRTDTLHPPDAVNKTLTKTKEDREYF